MEVRELLMERKGKELKNMAVSVRWRFGGNEIEVAGDEAFVEKHLARFEAMIEEGKVAPTWGNKLAGNGAGVTLHGELSPAEFYRKLRPKGGVESLVVLGKYPHQFRNQASFSKADIRSLCAEIRIKEIHPQYYSLALQRGLLRELDSGYAVTLSGDELIEKLAAKVTEVER